MSLRRRTAAALLVALAAGVVAPAAAQDASARPNYGTMNLSAGFEPDPRVVALHAGGDIAAATISPACAGFITDAPDVRVNYEAGGLPLILSVDSRVDTTLVVNGPDGSWSCNDDGGVNGANPAVRFNSPLSGQYDIWIGTYQAGATRPARLHVSEVSSQ